MSDAPRPPEGPPPFLDKTPPPLVARGLTWLVIAFFGVAGLLSVVVQVPETVRSPFVLVPVRGSDPLRVPRAGTVTTVGVAESARVAKGDVLFVLRSPSAGDRSSELSTAQAREASAREGLANARRKFESETLSAEEEMKRLLERIAFLDRMLRLKKEQLALTADQAARATKLHEQGLASLDEQSDTQIRHSSTAMEFEQLRTDRAEATTAVEKLRFAERTRRTAFHEEERQLLDKAAEARIRIDTLGGEPSAGSAGDLSIVAPCDGTVLRLETRAAGAVVREGDVLCELACTAERLQAELTVPQGALARIGPGQDVKLLYDAFPYQRFGVRHGVVRWASPAGVGAKDASTFRAFAELADQSIRVDGEPRPLLAGMRGEALVVVGRRSAISYAFEPLRQLRETLR